MAPRSALYTSPFFKIIFSSLSLLINKVYFVVDGQSSLALNYLLFSPSLNRPISAGWRISFDFYPAKWLQSHARSTSIDRSTFISENKSLGRFLKECACRVETFFESRRHVSRSVCTAEKKGVTAPPPPPQLEMLPALAPTSLRSLRYRELFGESSLEEFSWCLFAFHFQPDCHTRFSTNWKNRIG